MSTNNVWDYWTEKRRRTLEDPLSVATKHDSRYPLGLKVVRTLTVQIDGDDAFRPEVDDFALAIVFQTIEQCHPDYHIGLEFVFFTNHLDRARALIATRAQAEVTYAKAYIHHEIPERRICPAAEHAVRHAYQPYLPYVKFHQDFGAQSFTAAEATKDYRLLEAEHNAWELLDEDTGRSLVTPDGDVQAARPAGGPGAPATPRVDELPVQDGNGAAKVDQQPTDEQLTDRLAEAHGLGQTSGLLSAIAFLWGREERGTDLAFALAKEFNIKGPFCYVCGRPAVCRGFEGRQGSTQIYKTCCNDHCGHGNEDGRCWPVGEKMPA